MTISMYKASAPIFVQFLTSLSAVLDKAAAHAEAKIIDPSVLLNSRLYPDMFPLARQVREATNHAASACGRVAGAELPTFTNAEASIPELKERIAKTIEFIKGLKPARTGLESLQSHQSLNPMQATGNAFLDQIVPHPPGTIGSIAADEARPNLGAELLIAAAASAVRSLQPGIEPTPRDTERPAHPIHGPDPSVLRNERKLHVDSFAK